VTGRTQPDPAADTLTANVLEYVGAWRPPARRSAVYVGPPAGKTRLEATGLRLGSFDGGPLGPDQVLIVGPSLCGDVVHHVLRGGALVVQGSSWLASGTGVSVDATFQGIGKALFSGELFQNPETLDLMLAPASPEYGLFNDQYYYGHGMFYKYGLLGHGGQALGYQSDVGYLPAEDMTIVLWTNSAENTAGQAATAVGEALGIVTTAVLP
jgi:hypothetical protein